MSDQNIKQHKTILGLDKLQECKCPVGGCMCVTHSVLWWSWWVFSRALLTQTNSPGLLNLRVEHSKDQHHRQAL